jgi:hypothetical protein
MQEANLLTLTKEVLMASTGLNRCTAKDKIQHHILNWIVIFRYRMVQHGISKNATLKSLGSLESILKRLKIIS